MNNQTEDHLCQARNDILSRLELPRESNLSWNFDHELDNIKTQDRVITQGLNLGDKLRPTSPPGYILQYFIPFGFLTLICMQIGG